MNDTAAILNILARQQKQLDAIEDKFDRLLAGLGDDEFGPSGYSGTGPKFKIKLSDAKPNVGSIDL